MPSILGANTLSSGFDVSNSVRFDAGSGPYLSRATSGDGNQRKSYLNIEDCLEAMYVSMKYYKSNINIINLGTDEYCTVKDSIKPICKIMGAKPKIKYKGGKKGWIGDNPFIFLDTRNIRDLGWTPKLSIQDGVLKTIQYLKTNEWVFEEKAK